jgi:hypothetical protein
MGSRAPSPDEEVVVLPALTLALAGSGLLLALAAAVSTGRNRRIGRGLLGVCALAEAVVLVQLVVGVQQMISLHRGGVLFLAYLVGTALIVPVAVVWAWTEPSRWGTGVLMVAGLVIAVLAARLTQVWNTGV